MDSKEDDRCNVYQQGNDTAIHSWPSYHMNPFTRVHKAEALLCAYTINPKANCPLNA